ncbi:MAG TPA: TatD family hydrolase [Oligoflexia bacterium]|nr:TatD family hydrolase [Oligoflexia bacterium]HMP26814.1 TatD family hydrolase [Oligoflexia bacterium]
MISGIEFFDTHCHLNDPQFDQDREEVVKRARTGGVKHILCIGASKGIQSNQKALSIAEKDEFIYASIGIHPNDPANFESIEEIEKLAHHPKVVAIGEAGLDLYWQQDNLSEQIKIFIKQIALAKKLKKPLIIHSRAAAKECLDILTRENVAEVGGVFHCFSEDQVFAERLAEMGFYVSFPGSLTFKKNELARKVASAIPIFQILLETDAPYLAPQSKRGKRCESADLVEIAEILALCKGLTIKEVAQVTTENAKKLFKLK